MWTTKRYFSEIKSFTPSTPFAKDCYYSIDFWCVIYILQPMLILHITDDTSIWLKCIDMVPKER